LFSFVFVFCWTLLRLVHARQAGLAVVGGGGRGALGSNLIRLDRAQHAIHGAEAPLLCLVRSGPHLHALHVPVHAPVDLRGAHAPGSAHARRRHLVLVDVEPDEVAEVVRAQNSLDLGAHFRVATPLDGVHEVGIGDGVHQAELLHGHLALGGEEGEVLGPRSGRPAEGDHEVPCAGGVPKGVTEHFCLAFLLLLVGDWA
jgi:hypothetical protein